MIDLNILATRSFFSVAASPLLTALTLDKPPQELQPTAATLGSETSMRGKAQSALEAEHPKCPVPPKATKERLVDPYHRERFEDASLF